MHVKITLTQHSGGLPALSWRQAVNHPSFLHTDGLRVVDEEGTPVPLRGINLGCWLLIERWIAEVDQGWDDRLRTAAAGMGVAAEAEAALRDFSPDADSMTAEGLLAALERTLTGNGISSGQARALCSALREPPLIADEAMLWSVLEERFGADGMAALRQAYREAWITEADIRRVASLGLNLVRIPFNYRVLEEPDGYSWLDRAVSWCAAHGVYALLDMHGAPGGQNEAEHSGQRGVNSLFREERHLQHTVQLWTEIASRYADRPEVCGYNLLNEPWGAPSPEALCDLYHRLLAAIRQVDARHMLFLDEGFKGFWNMPDPTRHGWENVVYAMHFYSTDAKSPDDNRAYVERLFPYLRALQERQGVPYYFGEFSTISEAQGGVEGMAQYLAGLNAYGWSWSPWTYKRVSPHAPYGLWGLYQVNGSWDPPAVRTDSYDVLMAKMARYRTEGFTLHEAYAQALRTYGEGAAPRGDAPVADYIPEHQAMMRHRLTRAELGSVLEVVPELAQTCGKAWPRVLQAEVYAFADPGELPEEARSLLIARFGSVEAFGVLWYCIAASQQACKSCDPYWSETAEGHNVRLGIPYAMHPGNLALLLEYSPQFRKLLI